MPSCAMRPMRLPALSVNQSVPSRAIATVVGPLPGLGSENSENAPVAAGAASAEMDQRAKRRYRQAEQRVTDDMDARRARRLTLIQTC